MTNPAIPNSLGHKSDSETGAPMIVTTEVLSDLRLAAYKQVAEIYGGRIALSEVAGPGDTMILDTTFVLGKTGRDGNMRDRGTLLGVNLEELPTVGAQTRLEQFSVPTGHHGVLIERPADYFESRVGRMLRGLNMSVFYERTNEVFDQLSHEQQQVPESIPE